MDKRQLLIYLRLPFNVSLQKAVKKGVDLQLWNKTEFGYNSKGWKYMQQKLTQILCNTQKYYLDNNQNLQPTQQYLQKLQKTDSQNNRTNDRIAFYYNWFTKQKLKKGMKSNRVTLITFQLEGELQIIKPNVNDKIDIQKHKVNEIFNTILSDWQSLSFSGIDNLINRYGEQIINKYQKKNTNVYSISWISGPDGKILKASQKFKQDILNVPLRFSEYKIGDKDQPWDTHKNQCVIDYISYLYKLDIDEILSEFRDFGVNMDNKQDGISVSQIGAWCQKKKISIKVVDILENIVYQYKGLKQRKSMVFRIQCEHIIPIDKNDEKMNNDIEHYKLNSQEPQKSLKKKIIQLIEQEKIIPSPHTQITNDQKKIKLGNKTYIIDDEQQSTMILKNQLQDLWKGQTLIEYLYSKIKEYNLIWSHMGENHKVFLAPERSKRIHVGFINQQSHDLIQNLKDNKEKENYKSIDIHGCYRYACMRYPEYLCYLLPNAEWQIFKQQYDIRPNEFYYIDTNDTTLFSGQGVYSYLIVQNGLTDNIITKKQIQQCIKCNTLDGNYLNNFIEQCEIDNLQNSNQIKGLNKLIANTTIGLMGKYKIQYQKTIVTNSDTDINHVQQKYQDSKTLINIINLKNIEENYDSGKQKYKILLKNNVPFNIQIVDFSNCILYQLSKIGKPLWRNTDNIIFESIDQRKLQKLPLQYGTLPGQLYETQTIFSTQNIENPNKTSYSFEIKQVNFQNQVDNFTDIIQIITDKLKDKQSFCIFGKSGTGKTTILNSFCKQILKENNQKYACLAYTNTASKNQKFNGQTLHNFFRLKVTEENNYVQMFKQLSQIQMFEIESLFDYLIIDEISMIPLYLWNMIYQLKFYTSINLILCGDYRQCAPVEKSTNSINFLKTSTFNAIIDYNIYELSQIHRYDEKLSQFLDQILQYIDDQDQQKKLIDICSTKLKRTNTILKDQQHICYLNKTKDSIHQNLNLQFSNLQLNQKLISRINIQHINLFKNEIFMVLNLFKNNDKNLIYEIKKLNEDKNFQMSQADVEKYFDFASCMTVYKLQGYTINEDIVIHDLEYLCQDTKKIYTALSRVKNLDKIYTYFKIC